MESGTARGVPGLLDQARAVGVAPAQARAIFLTHAHLDHAGGAAALAQASPEAILYAHPRAARHLVDPSKLEKGARAVYGDALFEDLYGPRLSPIPAHRVRTLEDGERVTTEIGIWEAWHTLGHAKHHLCLVDHRLEGIFTGDTFGLCYPLLQRQGLFVFASTSPTDFDPEEARRSIRRIAQSGLRTAYLTHYGPVTDIQGASAQLLAWIDRSEAIAEQVTKAGLSGKALQKECERRLRIEFERELHQRGLASDSDTWALLDLDIRLNAQGIAHFCGTRRT